MEKDISLNYNQIFDIIVKLLPEFDLQSEYELLDYVDNNSKVIVKWNPDCDRALMMLAEDEHSSNLSYNENY